MAARIQLKAGRRVENAKQTSHRTTEARKEPVRQDPKAREFKLTGLSLKTLIRQQPPYIKNNAHEVVVKALQEVTTKGGLPAIRAKTVSINNLGNNRRRTTYDTNIIGKEIGIPLHKQKHVLVSCNCDFFLYYCEVALNHWGSARIQFSNGEHPGVTNPGLHPLMCKHLTRLAQEVMESQL